MKKKALYGLCVCTCLVGPCAVTEFPPPHLQTPASAASAAMSGSVEVIDVDLLNDDDGGASVPIIVVDSDDDGAIPGDIASHGQCQSSLPFIIVITI